MFGLSIIKHVTLQKIVAHDFRYVPRTYKTVNSVYGTIGIVCKNYSTHKYIMWVNCRMLNVTSGGKYSYLLSLQG